MKKKNLTLVILAIFVIALVPLKGIFASLTEDKQAAEQKVSQFKSELESVKGQADEILGKVDVVQGQIVSVEDKIAVLDSEKITLENNIVKKEEQVEVAKLAFDAKKATVYDRARQVYEAGDADYTAVVLSSFNLTDFINNSEYYALMKESETQKVNEVKKERIKFEEQKKELEVAQVALEENKQQAEVEKGNLEVENQKLESAKAVVDEAITEKTKQLRAEEEGLAAIASEIQAASERYAAEIAALNNGGNGNQGNGDGGASTGGGTASASGMYMPTSGTISSPYGWRTWPDGRTEFHTGIDIAAPTGTSIVAARTGVVVHAGWVSGYGNTVILDHGDGMLTLYGHMNSIGASSGQTVSGGQFIGTVGSTGFSTGPHLHFQVGFGEVHSGHVNPMSYL